jgi:uncharacterized protein (DUF427 family)
MAAVHARRRSMTARATWQGELLAESDETVVVEGNHYFPPASVRRGRLVESETHTVCPWKGKASYFSVVVDGETNADAAWYYPAPYAAAAPIKDYVAFWRGVEVDAEATDGSPGPTPPGR